MTDYLEDRVAKIEKWKTTLVWDKDHVLSLIDENDKHTKALEKNSAAQARAIGEIKSDMIQICVRLSLLERAAKPWYKRLWKWAKGFWVWN